MLEVRHNTRGLFRDGRVAQLGERIHGMDEAAGSIPVTSTNLPIPITFVALAVGKPKPDHLLACLFSAGFSL